MPKPIICPSCGSKRPKKHNFCVKCGAKLKPFCYRCHFDRQYHKCGYDKCPSLYTYIKEKTNKINFTD